MRAIAKSALAFILCFAVIMISFLLSSRDFAVGVYGYIYCVAVCLAVSVYVYITSIRREKSDDELKRAMNKTCENGIVGVHIDGAKVGSPEEAFNAMADSLTERENRESTFLNTVAHDLRTPATCISGFADGILDGTIPPEKHEHYIGVISSEAKRLGRLTESLLEVARIEAGTKRYNMTDFDVCETARLVLISLESKIGDKRLEVEFNAPDSVRVFSDSDAVHRVLYNLCDNAVKFSDVGGRLCVSVEKDGSLCRVSVFNTGKGISKEDIPHVFDRFYKADPSKGLDGSGAGLGLYIVKSIIDSCGSGEPIRVESEEGKWCRFTFTLKCAD